MTTCAGRVGTWVSPFWLPAVAIAAGQPRLAGTLWLETPVESGSRRVLCKGASFGAF
jgi:hypothetical protein